MGDSSDNDSDSTAYDDAAPDGEGVDFTKHRDQRRRSILDYASKHMPTCGRLLNLPRPKGLFDVGDVVGEGGYVNVNVDRIRQCS